MSWFPFCVILSVPVSLLASHHLSVWSFSLHARDRKLINFVTFSLFLPHITVPKSYWVWSLKKNCDFPSGQRGWEVNEIDLTHAFHFLLIMKIEREPKVLQKTIILLVSCMKFIKFHFLLVVNIFYEEFRKNCPLQGIINCRTW